MSIKRPEHLHRDLARRAVILEERDTKPVGKW